MRRALLSTLCCPETGEDLTLEVKKQDRTGDILEGTLKSPGDNVYPIINGVPRFAKLPETHLESQTVKAFGQEWAYFDNYKGYINSKELLFEFIYPLDEQAIKGMKIVELGCGGGRWLERFAECDVELVVGIDLSGSVEQAVERARKYKNVEVIQANILKPPIKRVFDLAVSLGVIHHLSNPIMGLKAGLKVIKPEGRLAVWMYSKEGNELYLRLVRPLRKIGPLLPHRLLLAFSFLLAFPVYLHAHITNPILRELNKKLPLIEYFALIEKLRFVDVMNIVYDQLTPSLALYPSRKDVEEWVEASGGRMLEFTMRTNNSWRIQLAPKNSNRYR